MIQILENNNLVYRFPNNLKDQYQLSIDKLCSRTLEWKESFYIILLSNLELEFLRTKDNFNLDHFLTISSKPVIKGLRRIKKRKEVYFLSVEWNDMDKLRESLGLRKMYYNINLCRRIYTS